MPHSTSHQPAPSEQVRAAGWRLDAHAPATAVRRPRPDPVTAVVIDDHELFRFGLRSILEHGGIRVAGEASSAEAGLALIRRNAPDVAILEPRLPRGGGQAAIRSIVAAGPPTRLLVLTVEADEAEVTRAVLAGACGFLLKDASPAEIELGVRATACGDTMVSPRIARSLLEQLHGRHPEDGELESVSLSPREREVLRLVADGRDNSAIARELVISPYTVRNHVSNILLKLGAENRVQAAVYAVRNSLA